MIFGSKVFAGPIIVPPPFTFAKDGLPGREFLELSRNSSVARGFPVSVVLEVVSSVALNQGEAR